jgi:hypothetical protein
MIRRSKFRDSRPRPELPPEHPDRWQWRPMVEIALGPQPERRPLLFEIVVSQRGQEPTS